MGGKKKKIGPAGRYGVRYGKRIRTTISDMEKIQKRKHVCPRCNMSFVVRQSSGIWVCKKCGLKFAGLAYQPGR
jgi:large subunit ribosomal protein L37Ae